MRSVESARLKHLALAALLGTWAVDAVRVSADPIHARAAFSVPLAQPAPVAAFSLVELARHQLPAPAGKAYSHSSSLVLAAESNGRPTLVAYWFSGSRESGPDVEIASSRFDAKQDRWTVPSIVVNRHALARELDFGVRRLGNPVAWVDGRKRVHLFAVATGMGGWSASRVIHLISRDAGRSFSARRVLPLSPWFNTSSLVRAPAVPLSDGGAMLPMYFEFGNKYPIAMRVSATGDPVDIVRMSSDAEALQPTIIPLDPLRAIALLRSNGGDRSVKMLSTEDGGLSWTDEGPTTMPNPDSSLVGARLPDGTLLAVLNPSRDGRNRLAFAMSRSGGDWEIGNDVVSGAENEEFSYPSLLVDSDRIHIAYTHNRTNIEHRIYRMVTTR